MTEETKESNRKKPQYIALEVNEDGTFSRLNDEVCSSAKQVEEMITSLPADEISGREFYSVRLAKRIKPTVKVVVETERAEA